MKMENFFFRWAILVFAVFVSAHLGFLGITYESFGSLLAAALVLGVINTFVKPVLMLISIPFIVFSFGIMILLINAFLFKLASALVSGFHVESFGSALGGALVVSIISFLFGANRRQAVIRTNVPPPRPPQPPRGNPPPGKGPIIDV